MTRVRGFFGFALLAATVLGAGTSQAATTICALIESQNQGKLSALGQTNPICGTQIELLGFEYAVTSPRDQAAGQPAGAKQHKPVRIKKRWNAASPQFFQPLKDGDLLSKASFDFVAGRPAIEHSVEAPAQTSGISSPGLVDAGIDIIELTFQ